jgi:hypothetical protein
MTLPVLVIVGTDLRACRYALRLPLAQLNYLNQANSRDIRAGQSPPFDQPRAQGMFHGTSRRTHACVAAILLT